MLVCTSGRTSLITCCMLQRGMTPLHHAAALGDLPAMKLILKKADKSALEKKDRVRCDVANTLAGSSFMPPLLAPVCLCDCRQCGSTPLHHAALLDHPKAVQLLLRAGSNINAQKSVRVSMIRTRLSRRLTPRLPPTWFSERPHTTPRSSMDWPFERTGSAYPGWRRS